MIPVIPARISLDGEALILPQIDNTPRGIDIESGLPNEQIDLVMRALYETRAQRRQPFTDDEWARIRSRFKSSMTVLRQEAIEQIESGDWDDA